MCVFGGYGGIKVQTVIFLTFLRRGRVVSRVRKGAFLNALLSISRNDDAPMKANILQMRVEGAVRVLQARWRISMSERLASRNRRFRGPINRAGGLQQFRPGASLGIPF